MLLGIAHISTAFVFVKLLLFIKKKRKKELKFELFRNTEQSLDLLIWPYRNGSIYSHILYISLFSNCFISVWIELYVFECSTASNDNEFILCTPQYDNLNFNFLFSFSTFRYYANYRCTHSKIPWGHLRKRKKNLFFILSGYYGIWLYFDGNTARKRFSVSRPF